MSIAAAFLIPWSFARYRVDTLRLIRRRTLPIVGSGILLALHFASWISSLSHTSVASSALLVTTNPVFVGVGAWVLLKERIHPRLITGTVIALVGAFLISYGDLATGGRALHGDLLAIVGAVAMSGHLLIGRRQRQNIALTPYVTVVYAIAAVVLIMLALSAGQNLAGHSLRDYGLFVALAVGPQLLGHTSFNYSLRRISPSLLTLLMLVEPIGSSLLAYAVLSEVPPASTFLGGSVIIAGVVLALFRVKSSDPQEIEDF
jgi:drug/metabolite transporter (DMT)-like permease